MTMRTTKTQLISPSSKKSPTFFAPTPSIQKKEGTRKNNLIGKLIAKQLADKKFKEHIISLGETLQKLALKGTDATSDPLAGPSARLSALNLKFVFENSAKSILSDPDLKHFREQLSETVKRSPEAALALALTGVMAVYLANIDAKMKDLKHEFGKSGFSIGGGFDLGEVQDLKVKETEIYAQLATKLFSIKATGGLKKKDDSLIASAKTEAKVGDKKASATLGAGLDTKGSMFGTAKGAFKFGTRTSSLSSKFAIDSKGKMILSGKFAQDIFGTKDRKVTLNTALSIPLGGTAVLIKPGFKGKVKFNEEQSLQLGTSVVVSSDTGLQKLSGFLEYQHNGRLRFRFDGDIGGIKNKQSLTPTLPLDADTRTETKIQASLILFF